MAIPITCGECQSPYSVAENLIGKSIKCKQCGAMIAVAAPAAPAAKAVPAARAIQPAKAVQAAKPAAVALDDEDDDRPAKPIRKARRDADDEDDDAPRSKKGKADEKKKSPLVMVMVGLGALVLLGGATIGGLFAAGILGKEEAVVANSSVTPNQPTMPMPPGPISNGPNAVDPGSPPIVPGSTPSGPISTPKSVDTPKPLEVARTGMTRDDLIGGRMSKSTIAKVAQATILIEGEGHNGEQWSGSGWFGVSPGLVFTNAHVLNMTAPDSKPPAKLTFHLYKQDKSSGARFQYDRTIPNARIKVLGVDRHNDLAVLSVTNEPDLPTPLQVRASSELETLQKITVFGFPLSYNVASVGNLKNIKDMEMSARPTSVTTLRKDTLGRPQYVQYEGSSDPGNSGGPIVDNEGYVVSIVVLGIVGSEGISSALSYGVPTEVVFGLTAGRIDAFEFDTAYRKDGKICVPVITKCLDPMKKLNKVGIGFWVGDNKGDIRAPGTAKTEKLPGDMDHLYVDLKYDPETKKAVGEILLPELSPGRSYWAQGFYTNALLPAGYWTPGAIIELNGPPVDRVPTDLIAKFPVGTTRPIELTNSNAIREYEEGEGKTKDERVKISTTIKMTEHVGKGTPATGAAATLGFKYQSLDLKAQRGNRDLKVLPPKILELFNQSVTKVLAQASVNQSGTIMNYATDTRALPNPILQSFMKSMSDQALESLAVCSIPMPNKKVNPLEKWESKRTNRIFLSTSELNADELLGGATPAAGAPPAKSTKIRELKYEEKLTYTYVGTRQRLGTNEAVVRIDGVVTPAAGSREQASGYLKGYANVDLDNGAVVYAEIESEFEVDSSAKGIRKKVSGISNYKLTRGSSVK